MLWSFGFQHLVLPLPATIPGSWHHVLHMSEGMACLHALWHHIGHMSISLPRSQVERHLVLLCVRLHRLLPWPTTPRYSVDTQLSGLLTPRSEPMQRATSSFSVDLRDFGPWGEFSSRDQSRIFFYARSDEMNIFNKLQTNFNFEGKYFPSLRLLRKIP